MQISLTVAMCILLLSSKHPKYDLILLSNRDEFFSRPTEPLSIWPTPDSSCHDDHSEKSKLTGGRAVTRDQEKDGEETIRIVGGRDKSRGGTWLAFTTSGRIAALTNFRESKEFISPVSRGSLPMSYLESAESPMEHCRKLQEETSLSQVGGFSLLCADLRHLSRDGVVVMSNRSPTTVEETLTISEPVVILRPSRGGDSGDSVASGENPGARQTCGQACELSNSHVSQSWPKTDLGRELLDLAIERSLASDAARHETGVKDQDDRVFLDSLFEVLSTDTLAIKAVEGMKASIFIPELGLGQGGDTYGTRQQTVMLFQASSGKVRIHERTIASGTKERSEVMQEFRI